MGLDPLVRQPILGQVLLKLARDVAAARSRAESRHLESAGAGFSTDFTSDSSHTSLDALQHFGLQ